MKRAVLTLAIVGLLAVMAGCGGGGSDNPQDITTGPLDLVLFAASPDGGYATSANPLRVGLTWNLTGGKAPFYMALDWNNDGQMDFYLNEVYQRTTSIFHDYYPIGATPYQTVLRITDSDNTVIVSDPVTITLQDTQNLTFDAAATYADDDSSAVNTPPALDYQFPSGAPVFFRIAPMNGAEPYSYQWDFNGDGSVDSTVPQATYTYTYTGAGAKTYKARVTVLDSSEEVIVHDYVLAIKGTAVNPPAVPEFDVILNTNPTAVGTDAGTGFPLITIPFQAGSSDPSVPTEPKLDMSITVNSDPTKAGVPPYEYYWDFDNDGAFETQDPSPTIPFYDDSRKLFVNPYKLLASEIQKTFTLRCLVIDSSGQRQDELRTVVVRRITDQPTEFEATPSYGVVSGPYAGQHFSEIADADTTIGGMQYPDVPVQFQLSNITGSTGNYQWQIDIDGNGLPDLPLVDDDNNAVTPPVPGWGDVSGTSINTTIHFGPYDHDTNPGTPAITDWTVPGYYATKLSLRSRELTGTPPVWSVTDTLAFQMPVSLVMRPAMDEVSGVLKPRGGHSVTADWDNTQRRLFIIGGAQGTTPMRDVETITQIVDGDNNTPDPLVATAHTWLNYERHGSVLFGDIDNPVVYMCGGYNLINGILASMETLSFSNIASDNPWNLYGEQAIELGYYPLDQAMGQRAYINEQMWWESGGFNAGFVIVGGLHPPSEGDNDQVSGRLLSFDPGRPPAFLPAFVAMDNGNRGMITERYAGSATYLNGRLYVIGGRVASGAATSNVEAFDFQSAQWVLLPPMQQARAGHCSYVIDDGQHQLIYVIGGAYYPPGGAQRTVMTTAEVYNPDTQTWSYTLPPALATERAGSVVLPSKDSLTGVGNLNAVWYYGGKDAANAERNTLQELVY